MAGAPLHIHLLAIGGTGMAPLACLLQAEGHRVSGSDGPLYPPMSTLLAAAGLAPLAGYEAGHLEPRPDLVVVGNAVRRDNPEVTAAEAAGIPRLSMPEALARFFLADRQPLVVAGTHGKTTTSAMAAWVYAACGEEPGYLVGGLPMDLPASFARGAGPRFVVEGDEYNAAFFDRGPKFLHYRPQGLVLTSIEYDHADLYPSPAALREAYRQLLDLLPRDGLLVACAEATGVRELAAAAPCHPRLYGLAAGEVVLAGPPEVGAEGTRFRVRDPEHGEVEIALPMWGMQNVANALAVWTFATRDGLSPEGVAAALGRFHGVRRRQEHVGTARGVTVIDDFAHHPTAVARTLEGLRGRFTNRRLVVAFEPRSLTAGRTFFHELYRQAFRHADRVLFAPLFHRERLAAEERLDLEALADELAADGTSAVACASVDQVLATALAEAQWGDVVVTMSSGDFGRLPQRLFAALGSAAADPAVAPAGR